MKRSAAGPLLLAVAAGLSAQTRPPGWDLIPPDAVVIVGIDLRQFRQSPLAQTVQAQTLGQFQSSGLMAARIPGLEELSKDGERQLVAATAVQGPAPRYLSVLEGNFDPAHLQ